MKLKDQERWLKGQELYWNFFGPDSVWLVDAWLMAISYYLFWGDTDREDVPIPALENDREEMARRLEVCVRRNKWLEQESDVVVDGRLRNQCRRIAGAEGPAPERINLEDIIPKQKFRRESEQVSHAQHFSIGNHNYPREC